MNKNVIVLGTGMAGYGASQHLHAHGVRPIVFDQNRHFGGHTASFRNKQGFLFDLGPHISFTKDERMQKLFAEWVRDDYYSVQVKLNNYWQGLRLTHPVQLHLNGLPHEMIVEIIADFVKEHDAAERPIRHYDDWLVGSYGRKFAEYFPMRYTRKYHTTPAENMSTDWLGPRMYRPSLEELLRGALAPWTPNVHYITGFRYPKDGGFISYLSQFPSIADIRLGNQVTAIDPKRRTVTFENGMCADYSRLVSSVALPDLITMIAGAPSDVLAASKRLACTTCVLVNVGVNRSDISDSHITYVYDEDIIFTRLSFPHLLSPTNVPSGCGSVQAELYFSNKYKPLRQDPDSLIDQVISDLKKMGTFRPDETILSREARIVQHANVIFDHDRAAAVATVHAYLKDVGIHYCGRYGDWGYMWTDESYISGERAAADALAS